MTGFPKFQPPPTREQEVLEGKDSKQLAQSWYRWFNLVAPKLTAPVISGTPATSAANGTLGQIAADQNFIYVCLQSTTPTQNALWKRVALSVF